MVSGSSIHRVLRCAASAALPQVDETSDDPGVEHGKQVHAHLERVASGVPIEESIAFADDSAKASLLVLDHDRLPTHLAGEVAFAWDWQRRTARELGRNLARAYVGLGETEIPLTVDVLGVANAGARVLVADYKTGWTVYPKPQEYGQLQIGGLAAATVYDADEAELQLIRLPDGSAEPWITTGSASSWELQGFGDEVERAMVRVAKARELVKLGRTPDVNVGHHCRYCPARKACPSTTALVLALPDNVAATRGPGYLAPDRIARTYEQAIALKGLIDGVLDEIYALAATEPGGIQVRPGVWLRPKRRRTERIVSETGGSIVYRVLEELHGPQVAEMGTRRTASKESIKAALGQIAPKLKRKVATKKKDGLFDEVMRLVDQRGGLEVSTTANVAEVEE
jgi:hypothetical protein